MGYMSVSSTYISHQPDSGIPDRMTDVKQNNGQRRLNASVTIKPAKRQAQCYVSSAITESDNSRHRRPNLHPQAEQRSQSDIKNE
jgi:hypothetical protein